MNLTHNQKVRYSRNVSLSEIGEEGQKKLLKSRILVVGAGGLGSPVLMYLAASGIGKLGIVDHDRVSISNLQRQIIHETEDIDRLKTDSAKDTISYLNPDIDVEIFSEKLNLENAEKIIKKYDIVADCSDNFETRFLVNEVCFKNQKTLVSAAMIGFIGHLYVFKPYLKGNNPCYRCLVPEIPSKDNTPRCSESGVLGSIGGVLGALQATEIIKEILKIGKTLGGCMIKYNSLESEFKKIKINRDSNCVCCKNFS